MSKLEPSEIDWDVLQLSEEETNEIMKIGLLFCKTNVYIYKSGSPKDKIRGYLSFVEEDAGKYALVWAPEHLISIDQRKSYKEVEKTPRIQVLEVDSKTILKAEIHIPSPKMHTTVEATSTSDFSCWVDLQQIDSILIQPPSITEWHGSLIFTLKNEESLPPLWFHNAQTDAKLWGGDEVLAWLCQLGSLTESKTNQNLFFLNRKNRSTEREPESEQRSSYGESTITNQIFSQGLSLFDPQQKASLKNAAHEFTWSVLEKFSKVTQFTKHSAAQILDHPLGRPLVPFLPPGFVEIVEASPAAQDVMQEYEGAKTYLTRWANSVVQKAKKNREYNSDPENDVDEDFLEETNLGTFEVLSDFSYVSEESLRTSPITSQLWYRYFEGSTKENTEGRLLMSEEDIKSAIFSGGVEAKIRPVVWKYLLRIYPWNSTEAERNEINVHNKTEYMRLKDLWFGHPEVENDAEFHDQKHRIEKDVLRTDRTNPLFLEEVVSSKGSLDALSTTGLPGTNSNLEMLKQILITYNYYNADLGYVQGMSDLIAPLFVVMQDEVDTFWCFVHFMERMKANFYTDQSGMNRQLRTLESLIQFMDPPMYRHLEKSDSLNLFFCFRWLLIWFKREFEYEDVKRLWEILWTDHICQDFHLFVALAIINQNRKVILELTAFDEILKWANEQSMHIDLEETLCRAEILYRRFSQRVDAADRIAKSTLQSSTYTGACDPVPPVLRKILKTKLLHD